MPFFIFGSMRITESTKMVVKKKKCQNVISLANLFTASVKNSSKLF